jgi:hypothetical protein
MEIHPADARARGILDGGPVRLRSRRGTIVVRARVTTGIAAGTVFVPFHFAEAAANLLTHAALDRREDSGVQGLRGRHRAGRHGPRDRPGRRAPAMTESLAPAGPPAGRVPLKRSLYRYVLQRSLRHQLALSGLVLVSSTITSRRIAKVRYDQIIATCKASMPPPGSPP